MSEKKAWKAPEIEELNTSKTNADPHVGDVHDGAYVYEIGDDGLMYRREALS